MTRGSGADRLTLRESPFFDDAGNPNDVFPTSGLLAAVNLIKTSIENVIGRG